MDKKQRKLQRRSAHTIASLPSSLHDNVVDQSHRADAPMAPKEAKFPRKKEPVVVKFQDPRIKKPKVASMDKPVSKILVTRRDQLKMQQEAKAELKEMSKDVLKFGISGFDYKQRKKVEQETVERLGGQKHKDNKMPYPLYMKVQKIRKDRERTKRQLDLATGNMDAKAKKRSDKDKKKSNSHHSIGHWVDRSKGSNPSVGKYKNGIYFVKS
ncbi:hypothetical protein TrispH2_002761 [Trichoplax sp. H2]|uniref:Uncharacterized protein n=1 Tax=Trichoplax adhaerens TaxID=10228 RepID=B3RQD2_TRIAD|nr:predicted protein [Trichoplax adhaerens]EDV27810.1 predicted protein [Trichoplax adhaerens]RDD45674.1 hypothetical protein TrispH2_002761 [Trichoplax sp. H2]|eukprot:XP_002109644.1 predicted protein [Trichoplax adhaerens]